MINFELLCSSGDTCALIRDRAKHGKIPIVFASFIRDRAKHGKVPIVIVPFIILSSDFAGDLHHLNVYEKSFLFGKVVRPGEKLYILCVTFKSHTWKTTRWRYFCNAHNSHILCRTFKNLISIHAG